ncbi:glycerol-3-phosphate dehydrogenase/oxidase [Pseudonocardia sp. TRM90224]|uniref:glycerol-3-phosphate dehydrogenase/oxidase n=1 Tax=Pseudonocardia sp. TRM90224 TaxID=2812678 RepID=UPI001E4D5B7A|nr:glycerol-3-phosphate dehydrogenase/oxidase [Pseudonocardia sp. TRM90224]
MTALSPQLSPQQRRDALGTARGGAFDLVVVGGGVTGAGVALDAAARGLSVVLLEAGDIAAGTSSRSGKTMHGGLRYLEQLNFRLVAEALRERDLASRTLAPHLVTPEPFLYPLTHKYERPYVGAGVALYDLMALARTGHGMPHHRHLSRTGVRREAPGLDPAVVSGGIQYYDGRMDDARHTLAVARTAAAQGAVVVTRARVVGVRREGAQSVVSVSVSDSVEGGDDRFDVRGSVVVNAAGVWAADVQAMAGAATFTVRPAKGVHLLFDESAFDSRTGVLARAEDSVIIIRRWFGHWLLGTTDTAFAGDRSAPVVEAQDVDYLLRNINKYLARPLGRADVLGTFAGLRPLLAPAAGNASATSAISRDHAVITEPAGMVTIVGGKYTTYRRMARDAVDAAARMLGRTVPPSPTETLPLVGAAGWAGIRHRTRLIAEEHGVAEADVRRMLHRYGDEVPAVLSVVHADPALAKPVPGAEGYLGAELLYAVTHEGATTLADVMVRRTRLSIERPDGAVDAAPAVAALLAQELGWTKDHQATEVAAYTKEWARDRAALG